MGGHSLGGAMAASYVSKNEDDFRGLVLLAAYSTADLSDSDLHVISLYGSEDGVLNMEKYEKYRSNLPEDTAEDIIDGGCHAYFGMYGEQRGDGEAKITNEEQILYTAEAVYGMMAEHR
jgi:pimeloyl-ACP methyl ester carboxylesterase